MTTSRYTPLLLAGTLLCGAALLSGCSSSTSSTPPATASATARATSAAGSPTALTPRPTVPTTPLEQTGDIFELAIGDCVNDDADSQVSEVPTIDCAAPHDLEVYDEFDLADSATFPGTGAVGDAAQSGCKDRFASFVGVPYEESVLAFTEYVPTESSWASGDRTVICVLGDPNARSTGTLRGAAG